MLYCDFCGKSTKEVKRMIAGQNGSAICSECVIICMEALMDNIRDLEDNTISIKESEVDFDNKKCSCGGKLELHQLMCNPPIDVYMCNKCNTTHKR